MDKNGKILIVDDAKSNREILSEILNQYTVIEAKDGYEALEYLKSDSKSVALVLLDLVMPEMDGFEVLKYMNQNHLIEEVPVMIISIDKDDKSIEKAYELGVSGYITRPFSSAVVLKKINNIISHYKRQKKLTTIINKQIYEKYKNNDMMIMILSHIVESRNGESGLHVLHIKKLTKLLLNILVKKTNQYSLTLDDMISIEVASSLHDIGKIAIPEEILNKPSSLTKEEMEVMKSHVIIGAKMLNSLPFYNDEPIVKYGYQICRWHHERYDGNGYPDGLKGEEIPIAAQVVSIVDAYDALTSKRVYKEAYSHEEALKMIQKGKCGVFNPLLIECLMDIESYIQNDLKINDILNDARIKGCSDVHIGENTGITLRQDGKLIEFEQTFSNEEIKEMILSMCKDRILKIVEKHEDADFVYVNDLGRHRVNIYFQQGYMTAAIRIINEQIKTLEELNLPDVLHKLALLPRGLVLVTGPTGSGKSTTLAAMIDFISSMRNCHILTIEDPIEYVYQQKQALIHQREVYEDVDSFDTALKSAMREDPDVILVGEMRDYETIQAVITLAETGHLVFSTLHTIGAPKTIDRIIDVFPPHKQAQIRAQLASVLQAVVTQQLLPLASGKGRAAALEIMIANDAIKNLIRENKGHQIDTMIQTGRNEGMTTLNASLATLVNTGKVNRMVAERYSLDVGELRQLIR